MTAASRLESARGALLGTFVGDALGMPFEGGPSTGVPDRLEMVDARLGRGTYTDDTEMTIALAESLIECGRVDEQHLAERFLERFDPRRGYGGGTRQVLELWRSGTPVERAAGEIFGGLGSCGNGAAMRVAPVAVRFAHDPRRVESEAQLSARVTHRHPVAIDGARVQASAIAAAVRGEDALTVAERAAATAELRSALERVDTLRSAEPEPAVAASELGNESTGDRSVPTAILAAVSQATFEDAVTFAVRCGGDTDTIAAMTGAIAGAGGGAAAIPERWLAALEDGERGRGYVEGLAARLIEDR